MSSRRRDFLKQLFAAGALPGLFARPGAFAVLLDPQTAQQVNPDFDAQSYNFWSGFTAKNGTLGHRGNRANARRRRQTIPSPSFCITDPTDSRMPRCSIRANWSRKATSW